MKKQNLKKPTLKFKITRVQRLIKSITLALVVVVAVACEKEIVPDTISQQEETSTDHTVKRLSLSDFIGTNTFKSVEKTIIKPKDDNFSYQKRDSGATDNEFEFTSDEVLSGQLNGETTYTTPIKKTSGEDPDYNYNLLIKESAQGVTNFLIKYSKISDQIIIQPIISSVTNTNIPTINSEVDCVTWNWSVTVPCSCAGHTYECLCGTPQFPGTASYSNSGNVTVCYETPAIVSFDPNSGGGGTGGYDSGQNNGYSNGGSNSDGSPIPIFVYEGDSLPCDNPELCPPLYWAQSQAWQEHQEAEDIGLDDFLFSLFINTLPQEQQDFLNDFDNRDIRGQIQNFYNENNTPEDEAFIEAYLNFENDENWRDLLQQAVANGVTSTAELTHKIYTKLSVIAQAHPSSITYINSVIDEFKEIADEVFDTNPQTLEWIDLFGIWLFELGTYPSSSSTETINFDGDDTTTQSLKQQEGVNEARQMAIDKINNNDLSDPTVSNPWTYGQGEFYDGMSNGNIATSFLGSYSTNIVITQNSDGTHTLTFTVTNPSTWDSATRLRIDNDGDGNHDGIFPNKERDQGIHLGGNINQIWTWTETI